MDRRFRSLRLSGFLSRLARDTRGNALMIMAAMLIPLAGFSGSAIDMARLYTVRTRLQQACDAGVLAGRKSLSGTNLDTSGTGQAQTFFKNNFNTGWFKTTNVGFTPSLTSDNQVQGTANATVPMTLMAMFGQPSRTITVNCTARYDVADADIMFVLDATGSMACLPSDDLNTCNNYDISQSNSSNKDANGYYIPEKPGSRISAVRTAVLNFFDTVTGQADQTTNFRFGFVPFNVSVNVGRVLNTMGYMATSWTYQSRHVSADYVKSTDDPTYPSATTQKACTGDASATGLNVTVRAPAAALTYDTAGTATNTNLVWSPTASRKCTSTVSHLVPTWVYTAEPGFPVSQYLASTAQSPITNPAQVTSATTFWPGCVEERGTNAGATSFDTAGPPWDLEINKAPTTSGGGTMGPPSSASNSYWGPAWPDVQFARNSPNETSTDQSRDIYWRPTWPYTNYELYLEGAACPVAPVSRLKDITVAGSNDSGTRSGSAGSARSLIQTYLSAAKGYRPWGSTYLDEGMVWGARMLSPNGMFKDDTAAWSGHNAPNRYLIFLTDGNMESDCYADAAHGMEAYDQRVGNNGCSSDLQTLHYNRLAAACTIAKNQNITVFTIVFGQSVSGMPSQFTGCASPGQTYIATDTAALNTAFSKIAQQVAMLRLSK